MASCATVSTKEPMPWRDGRWRALLSPSMTTFDPPRLIRRVGLDELFRSVFDRPTTPISEALMLFRARCRDTCRAYESSTASAQRLSPWATTIDISLNLDLSARRG